jgi:hypothetical protein
MLIVLRLCQIVCVILYFRVLLDLLRNDPDSRWHKMLKSYPRLFSFAFAFTIASSIFIAAVIAAFGLNLQSEYGRKVATPRLRMISLFYVFTVIPLFIALLYVETRHAH